MITPEQFQEIGETLLPLLDDLLAGATAEGLAFGAWRDIQHHAHNSWRDESEIYRYLRRGLLESAHGRAILLCSVNGWDQSARRSPADCAVSIRA